jgi:hypothetical protein
MDFKRFSSGLPLTPYAPTWDFRVGTTLCENIDVKSLSQFLLKKEKEVKKLPVQFYEKNKVFDGYTGLGSNSTTSRSNQYNILTWNHSEILKLKQNIIENIICYNNECGNQTPDNLKIQCWYNVLRYGQKIKPHQHSTRPFCYLSGHFNVKVENTSTVYMSPINQLNDPDVINIKNQNGEMTIFPSYIFHYTTPHYSFKPRITIAFDVAIPLS